MATSKMQILEDTTRSDVQQEAQLMLRNPARRDIIRREEKYRQAGESCSTAAAQRFYQIKKISKSTRVTGSTPR